MRASARVDIRPHSAMMHMSLHRRALIALALALWLAPPALAQGGDAASSRTVDELFSRFTRDSSPGLAVAFVKDGRTVFTRGYGLADLEHRIPITPSTVFDVASVSKQFTGLAIAMLVEQGRVKLDDDVRRYIPEFPDVGHTITINHLLHHTSGLRDWPGTLAVAGWRFDDVISFDQIHRMAMHQHSLNFVPGAEYTYSNTGYNMLAEVVQRVSGQSFREWTQERLFAPLGMTRSAFRDDHMMVIRDRAFGYSPAPRGQWAATTNNLTALGSSSLMSSAADLARWVINFDSARVGGTSAMAMTRTRGVLNDGRTIPYAFGISHGEYRGQPTVSHSGSWASFATFVVHFPSQHAGVVILANSPIVNPGRAAYQVADAFLGDAFGSVTAASGAPARPLQLTAATLDSLTGTYRLGPGWYADVRRDGTTLSVQATNEMRVPMQAASPREFWVPAYGASMTFVRGTDGKVTSLTYRGKPASRMPDAPSSPAPLGDYVGDYVSDELEATYHVELRGDSLVLVNWRHGPMPLTRRWGEDFGTGAWFLKSVAFTRGANGRVDGLVVNVDERSRDIRFRRAED
jgi:CubicO group peptidase (beta-lactamase class C family)